MSEDKAKEKETEAKKAEEVQAEEKKAEEKKADEKKAEEKKADDKKSVEERKAAKLESDRKDADKYFYPNKWARIVLTSAEEVMGPQGVRSMLNMAKIPQYIDNYPPDNMKKEFSFGGVGQLQQAIWDMYGARGARVFAVRAGEQSFQVGLSQFKSVATAAQVAMRVGSLEAKVKLGLEFFSKLFNTVTDQVVEVSEDDKHWIWKITHCPVCWGRVSDEPVCYLAIGVLQAGLSWVTEGKKFRIKETECKAMGHEDCIFMIEKVPVE